MRLPGEGSGLVPLDRVMAETYRPGQADAAPADDADRLGLGEMMLASARVIRLLGGPATELAMPSRPSSSGKSGKDSQNTTGDSHSTKIAKQIAHEQIRIDRQKGLDSAGP